jgi:Tfp pilus assembly protein FimT
MRCLNSRARAGGQNGFSTVEILMGMTIIAIMAALTIPVFSTIARNLRGEGDIHSISSSIGLAKMRAAASFSRARMRANLTARTYQVEVWDKTTSAWVQEGGTETLSDGVNFGFGTITTPPSNTQTSIGQAAACRTGAGAAIANTACVVFNSRGVPIDSTLSPTGEGAIYINDGAAAQGATVSITGLMRRWRRDLSGSTSWRQR